MRRCMVCLAEWDCGGGTVPVECPICRSTNTATVVALSGRIRLLDGREAEIGPAEFKDRLWERFRATLQSKRSGASVELVVATAAALLLLGAVAYAVVR